MPNLAIKTSCTGCTACVNACPRRCMHITKDENGFSYPQIVDLTECIECRRCESVCPVINKKPEAIESTRAYAAFSRNESVRLDSSSGGIFTEVSQTILLQGGVVFGASYDENYVVKHCCISDIHELWKLRGAKYSESDLGDTFSEILQRLRKGQKVLFSGTPCQVAGLKSFLRKEYDNLLCVDFVCHGVPSPVAWKSYVEYRAEQDAKGERPKAVNLRSKHTGWSNYRYSNVFEYENGKKYSALSSESLFMKLFVGDYISRTSCENCQFKGYQRVSDITLGDFWGIWDIDPEMDDDQGTSVVLVHSDKGQRVWQEIKDKIKCKEVSLEQASRHNPSMLNSSRANAGRDDALTWIRAGRIETCWNLLKKNKITVLNRVKNKMKRLIQRK